MEKLIFKKRTHLENFSYKGFYRYFITICYNYVINLRECEEVFNWLVGELRAISEKYNFDIWAYCFMPDHLHLLIEGRKENSDMVKFISMFKQKTGFCYKKKFKRDLWQINYYDHVLRKEEDAKDVAYYIFGNPVRKDIVDNYKNYPYLGSFVFTLEKNFLATLKGLPYE